MAEETQPQDFDPIFSQGVVIIGGHAVNLWASFYADRGDPLLARFAPFTSKDADIFLKDRDLALAVAAAAGWRFRSNPEPRSPVLGAIVMKKGGVELQVDVLRSVTGLTAKDLAATESITFANGKSYSVPAPEVMLKAKLANLAAHDQTDRQDERHVRILTRCSAHYLADACAAMQAGVLSEREAVERFMATHRWFANSGCRLRTSYGFSLSLGRREKSRGGNRCGTGRTGVSSESCRAELAAARAASRVPSFCQNMRSLVRRNVVYSINPKRSCRDCVPSGLNAQNCRTVSPARPATRYIMPRYET